ncbi:nitrite reductase small subunit NirD [Gorillibacterium sp. sgz5001074]|uniref:nitrite reductase small subunit NirD n=1 Tax=Gorillibacterium sp. sgz5001074 TaxID=3446695 RepID=UPI003F66EE49
MKKVVIGHRSEFTERRSRTAVIDGVEIAVFQLTGGAFRAVENRCPHKNGKLSEGIVCDHHVFCPLHDWKINLDDGKVQAPDEGAVDAYRVEVDEAGNVIVLLEKSGSLAS